MYNFRGAFAGRTFCLAPILSFYELWWQSDDRFPCARKDWPTEVTDPHTDKKKHARPAPLVINSVLHRTFQHDAYIHTALNWISVPPVGPPPPLSLSSFRSLISPLSFALCVSCASCGWASPKEAKPGIESSPPGRASTQRQSWCWSKRP